MTTRTVVPKLRDVIRSRTVERRLSGVDEHQSVRLSGPGITRRLDRSVGSIYNAQRSPRSRHQSKPANSSRTGGGFDKPCKHSKHVPMQRRRVRASDRRFDSCRRNIRSVRRSPGVRRSSLQTPSTPDSLDPRRSPTREKKKGLRQTVGSSASLESELPLIEIGRQTPVIHAASPTRFDHRGAGLLPLKRLLLPGTRSSAEHCHQTPTAVRRPRRCGSDTERLEGHRSSTRGPSYLIQDNGLNPRRKV
jgi:hypothetical protein